MIKLRNYNFTSFLRGVMSSWLFLTVLYAGTFTEANCPLSAYWGWVTNETIPYQASTFTTAELNSVAGAIGSWQYHNQHINCSGVWFPPYTGAALAYNIS